MSNEEGKVYYFPAIKEFKDTGFITHCFESGGSITARVVESDDSDGFAIQLVIKSDKEHKICDITMDRFAALCLVDCLTKNLLNQEELNDLKLTSIKENKNDVN